MNEIKINPRISFKLEY